MQCYILPSFEDTSVFNVWNDVLSPCPFLREPPYLAHAHYLFPCTDLRNSH